MEKILVALLLVQFCSCQNFTSQSKIESFEIYGRCNPNLKDSSRVMLSYTVDEESFMHVGTLKAVKPQMQRIHADIHYRKFPEIFSTIKKLDTLSFTSLPYNHAFINNYEHKIYTFYNKEKYNDFIVYYHPQKNIDKLSALYNVNSTPDFKLLTINYNDNHEEIESDKFKRKYDLDEKRNAYKDKWNYVDGEENAMDYDYNNINLLFIYKKMKEFDVLNKEITIDNNSIFK